MDEEKSNKVEVKDRIDAFPAHCIMHDCHECRSGHECRAAMEDKDDE